MNEKMLDMKVEKINELLEGMDAEFSVIHDRIPKNNVTRDAFVLRPKDDGTMSPTIYPNEEMMKKTDEEMVSFLMDIYKNHRMDTPDLAKILVKERILGTVLPKLVSAENAARLASRDQVYEKMLDLLLAYYIPVDEFGTLDGSTIATITVTEGMLRNANITMEELKAAALENMSKTVEIVSLGEVLKGLMGSDMEVFENVPPILVVTTKNKYMGAPAFLLEDVKKELESRLGSSYYCLPSSVHEILALSASAETDAMSLVQMVATINREQVAVEDRLVDNAYFVQNGKISMVA